MILAYFIINIDVYTLIYDLLEYLMKIYFKIFKKKYIKIILFYFLKFIFNISILKRYKNTKKLILNKYYFIHTIKHLKLKSLCHFYMEFGLLIITLSPNVSFLNGLR
jgi:hypothetical protein